MPIAPEHRDTVRAIRDHYRALEIGGRVGAREYAQLAVRSIITINAGAAVAYPAVAEVFLDEVATNQIIWPVALAILGTLLGIFCAYLAYFNFEFHASNAHANQELETTKADESFDQQTYHRFQAHRSRSKEFWEKEIKHTDKWVDRTFYAANIVGIFALICFCISVATFSVSASERASYEHPPVEADIQSEGTIMPLDLDEPVNERP